MDFHETCRLNNAAIEAGFEALLLAADLASRVALTDFADFVKSAGRVGLDMRPMVLLDFLNSASGGWPSTTILTAVSTSTSD